MKRLTSLILAGMALQGILLNGLHSQTCSCASAPLFNPVDYSFGQNKAWRLELAFKYHTMNDLVEGSHQVIDDTQRKREQQSLLLDIRYALSSHLYLRAAFSLVRQYRDVGISFSSPVSTQGGGDTLFSLQYVPFAYSSADSWALSLGVGIKAPTGKSDAKIVGLASEDMQPGTGSWDWMFWSVGARNFPVAAGLEIFAGLSVRFNGENSREYQFGHEVTASLGSRIHFPSRLSGSVYFRYRQAGNDKRFGADVPNTGGHWIFLVPGLTQSLWGDLGIKLGAEIPLYRKVNGFRQFTSTFLGTVSLFYEF